MLTRLFLSAKELGISAQMRDALIATLHAFERGEPRLAPRAVPVCDFSLGLRNTTPVGFNIAYIESYAEGCGAVGCILGWARHFAGNPHLGPGDSPKGFDMLSELFMMRGPNVIFSVDLNKITVEQAAAAINNYLTTGEAQWDQILADCHG